MSTAKRVKVGMTIGASVGALLGSVVPGLGNAIGGAIGMGLGAAAGLVLSKKTRKAVKNIFTKNKIDDQETEKMVKCSIIFDEKYLKPEINSISVAKACDLCLAQLLKEGSPKDYLFGNQCNHFSQVMVKDVQSNSATENLGITSKISVV